MANGLAPRPTDDRALLTDGGEDDGPPDERALLADGGEGESAEADEEGGGDEQESSGDDESGDAGDEEDAAEGEEATAEELSEGEEDESDESGAKVLYLDVQGVFLNLLGLQVDLSEVELDVDAVPGSGNLLGNLLSAVVGLFDTDVGGKLRSFLGGLVPDSVGGVSERVQGTVRDAVDDIPLEDLLGRLVSEVVNQLLDGTTEAAESDGDAAETGDAEASESAA